MSVAGMSNPQLLDPPLRPAEETVDVEAISVDLNLCRDPGGEPYQRLPEAEHPLEARKADLHLLPLAGLVGPLGHQQDPVLSQGVLRRFAALGVVAKQPAPNFLREAASPSNSLTKRTSLT